MSQTYSFSRAIRTRYRGHWHKLHLVVLEDCDADDDLGDCDRTMDEVFGDRLYQTLKKAIGFAEEPEH